MKKTILLIITCTFLFKPLAKADEGMWLPMLLGEQVYSDMVKKGLKVSKEQLYSMNQACIKDSLYFSLNFIKIRLSFSIECNVKTNIK